MTTSNDIPLAAKPIDRAAHRRLDAAWLSEAMKREDVLVLLMQAGKPFLADGQLAWLGPQATSLAADAKSVFLGQDKAETPIFALDMPEGWSLAASPIAGLGDFEDFRAAAGTLTLMEANCASTARSLFEWHRSHGFCAKCGAPSDVVEGGWKRACPVCGAEHFPRTDPVAIMLAVKDGKCLLGRGPGWPAGFMSCLAGFVEPGETVEQAAARELFEEAGIVADPAKAEYLFCQPWPFPSSLMIGIIIEAETHAITLDTKELADARWVTREEACAIMAGDHDEIYCPPPMAVAHHIMKVWAERDDERPPTPL
ncbi:MAG: NAD(+) diphosphatase [Pseudomonadota bacterium]